MRTKWISTLMTLVALCFFTLGCANLQHKADRSMLIQENLQLDQALSITQYELMLVQQENDALREQLEQLQNAGGGTSGGTSNNTTGGTRTTTLRSQYEEQVAPTFDANDPNLPPPSNQVPHFSNAHCKTNRRINRNASRSSFNNHHPFARHRTHELKPPPSPPMPRSGRRNGLGDFPPRTTRP